MIEISRGKDTTTGHWEFVGCVLEEPFESFMEAGFPDDIIAEFIEKTGCGGVLGNRAASGTVIIEELGQEPDRAFNLSTAPIVPIAGVVCFVVVLLKFKGCPIECNQVLHRQ